MALKDITDKQVVLASASYTKFRAMDVIECLEQMTGQPYKVCSRAVERAVDRKLLEYGVSLRTAWPTPEGLELLKGATNVEV